MFIIFLDDEEGATPEELRWGIPPAGAAERRFDSVCWALALRQGNHQRRVFARMSTTPYVNPSRRTASFKELRWGSPPVEPKWRHIDGELWAAALWRDR